jgi:large subunit ribosomal protein L31
MMIFLSIFPIVVGLFTFGDSLKDDIHPKYEMATISCACGNVFSTRTAVGDMKVDICSNCHPFYTGKQKLVDSAGRVDKYYRKYNLGRPK